MQGIYHIGGLKSGFISPTFAMAFRRNFAPAVANSMNVKGLQEQSRIDDGTSRANAIAEKDLQFWIHLDFICESLTYKFLV